MLEWLVGFVRSHALDFSWLALAALLGFLGKEIRRKGVFMLEGKEVSLDLGGLGKFEVDLNDKLELELTLVAKVDLFKEVVKLAKKTDTKIDDSAAELLGKLFGRKAEEVIAAVQA